MFRLATRSYFHSFLFSHTEQAFEIHKHLHHYNFPLYGNQALPAYTYSGEPGNEAIATLDIIIGK